MVVRMSRTTRSRALVALIAAISVSALAPATVAAQPAQTVEQLRARARQLAADLDRLSARSQQLDEEYLSIKAEVDELTARLADTQGQVAAAREALETSQRLARSYAVDAYVGGGNVDPVLMPSADAADASRRIAYLSTLNGDQRQVMDDLAAAREQLTEQENSLTRAKDRIDAKQAKLEATKAELTSTIRRHRELKASIDGELAAAVARAEAQLRAEREAAARREAQAAALRAAQAAARPPATVPPRPVTTDEGGDGETRGRVRAAGTGSTPADADELPDPGPVSPGAAAAIAAARSQLGVPYRWGGSTPGRGFDCSGLTQYAWAAGGRSLPHSSRAQHAMTRRITADELQPGDLVFGGSPVHHVGLYIGGGMMIHAPRTGDVIRIASIYSTSKPVSFGRL
jgi:cell wall-associated NlpC family hydrolase